MNENEMDKPTRRAIAHAASKQLQTSPGTARESKEGETPLWRGVGVLTETADVPRVGIYNSDSDSWEPTNDEPILTIESYCPYCDHVVTGLYKEGDDDHNRQTAANVRRVIEGHIRAKHDTNKDTIPKQS